MPKRVLALSFAAAFLAACVSEQTYQKEVQRSNTYEELSQKLQAEVDADQVEIEQLQGELKVTVVDGILFPEGGYVLSAKGRATLDKMAPTLAKLTDKRIVVEGFTDNVPIGPALKKHFPTNWELSTARATQVLRHLVSQGVPENEISAEGFGEQRPVASNDTPEGRAKNRRVEIVIKSEQSLGPTS